MQTLLFTDERTSVLEDIQARLRQRFGQPGPYVRLDPVSQLVVGIIGGRTHGRLSLAALEALVHRFGTWERVRDGREAAVRDAIRAVTYAEVKARRLQAALRAVTAARGGLTLEFLRAWTVAGAHVWLERLPGVGRKTAAATLNFSTLRRRTPVIDTHHLRVLRRFGLIGSRAGFAEAHDRIMPSLPEGWTADDLDDHHQLVKTLGQRICRHGLPDCGDCPLLNHCATARRRQREFSVRPIAPWKPVRWAVCPGPRHAHKSPSTLAPAGRRCPGGPMELESPNVGGPVKK